LERSLKSENESSTIEDYVYKLPPPKSRPEHEKNVIRRVPINLPRDVISTIDTKIVSDVLQFVFLFPLDFVFN